MLKTKLVPILKAFYESAPLKIIVMVSLFTSFMKTPMKHLLKVRVKKPKNYDFKKKEKAKKEKLEVEVDEDESVVDAREKTKTQ